MKKIRLEDFEAIAFDIEGTLADTIPTHHAARLEAFQNHGYGHITREQHELGPTYGSSTADIIGGILRATGEIQQDGPFKHHPAVQEVIASKMQLFEKSAAKGFDEMPDATHFVRLISAIFMGRMALVTSSPERFVLPFLDRYDIAKYFPKDYIISEDTIIAQGLEGKPAPDPYQLAMGRLGTSNLLVFEDTVSGVASAKAAGATVIALGFEPNNTKLFKSSDLPYPPDALVSNYTEARKLLNLM
jgi:HAD superfamily hydrolase (TIGR01509 family)